MIFWFMMTAMRVMNRACCCLIFSDMRGIHAIVLV
jgi:hypothetical protein